MSQARTLGSNGEREARAYVKCSIPTSRPEPPLDAARVVVCDPRLTASGGSKSSGPRNPEQSVWPAPKAPGIELPDRRPLHKAQRFWIDPELLEQWDREDEQKRAQGR